MGVESVSSGNRSGKGSVVPSPEDDSRQHLLVMWTALNCQTNEGCDGNPIGKCNPNLVLDSHAYNELSGLDIVTCVALIQTNHGKANMLIHEYVYYGRGNTIHSPCQIESFNNTCDDNSHHVGGKQI